MNNTERGSHSYRLWLLRSLLGGPWDLVTTYTGIITQNIIGATPISPVGGIISRVIIPAISSYYVPWASK